MNIFKIKKEIKDLQNEIENLKLQNSYIKNELKRINERSTTKESKHNLKQVELNDVTKLRRGDKNGE